mmetsp:Transcript_5596/g.12126  ORF Transcript_5596/g.12126 Transcript_5596/m.12126 type:complete len:637 (+) Transcript_5596:94-2004(+)
MAGPHTKDSDARQRPSTRLRSRLNLYDRYDVDINESPRSNRVCRSRGHLSPSRYDHDDDGPQDEVFYFQRLEKRNRFLWLMAFMLIVTATYMGMPSQVKSTDTDVSMIDYSEEAAKMSVTQIIGNTFVPKKKKQQKKKQKMFEKETPKVRKRWNPCLNTKYELERHDHEPRHGDICRAKGGTMGLYVCPEGCHETAGNTPYCANDKSGSKSKHTMGDKGGACRVRNPDAPPEYRCDYGGVCIMAVGSPKDQFKGVGQYYDDTCDGKCGDGRKGELTAWIAEKRPCTTDLECSLSGVCTPEGKCECDPWAEGPDCSYLKFEPVDRARLGYLDERHSSWGGSVVQKSDDSYHMYVSEIICKEDPDVRKRCGLNNWETHSRIAQATSTSIEGPYRRLASDPVILPPEHHNPSIHVKPTTGDWHLFTISGPTGPIERMISSDEGKTWGNPKTVSPRQNPGPLMMKDGSTYLFYRADGLDIPLPTCSNEGISVTHCPSDDGPCNPPNDMLIFGHTGEDPSVFVDHRGNYHMLFNALPYKCVPKFEQGGHAWSADGFNWSDPRIGAFDTTVKFTDGTDMKCERRERPQMVTGKDGRPVALVSAVTGCPKGLGDPSGSVGDGKLYRGADDSFTLVQKMSTAAE